MFEPTSWLIKIDRDGEIVWWPSDALTGRRLLEVIATPDRATAAEAMWSVMNGRTDAVRMQFRTGDDPTVLHCVLRSDGSGGLEGLVLPHRRLATPLASPLATRLTPRERDIAALIGLGCRPSEIAEELGISAHTVRNHLKSIFAKLGVNSQRQLRILVESDEPARDPWSPQDDRH